MEQIANSQDYDVWLEVLERPFLLRTPFRGEDFVLMLVVNDITMTHYEQAFLSNQIIQQGCRYAVCAGHQCSTWDDSIDMAFLGTDPDYNPPDDRFVMTTWHEEEPLADVVEWFRWSTSFDDFTPKNFLVLLLGENQDAKSEVKRALLRDF